MKYSLFIPVILATVAEASLIASGIVPDRNMTCGQDGLVYTPTDIDMAVFAACTHLKDDTTANGAHYPHKFYNYEEYAFEVPGPYMAYPLLQDTIYIEGYPGPDRVIVNKTCAVASQVHLVNNEEERDSFRFDRCYDASGDLTSTKRRKHGVRST